MAIVVPLAAWHATARCVHTLRTELRSSCMTASITCKQVLPWATVEGADELGLTQRVGGRIERGMQAGQVAVDAHALKPLARRQSDRRSSLLT